jgi:two-component system sensor histidine kinase RegB
MRARLIAHPGNGKARKQLSRGSVFEAIFPNMRTPSSLASTVDPWPAAPGDAADTPDMSTAQERGVGNRSLSIQALVILRAGLLVSQLFVLMVLWLGLGHPKPLVTCLALIAFSALIDVSIALSPAMKREAKQWEVFASLAFDILQVTVLLFLNGGVINGLGLMVIIPLTVAGGSLQPRWAGALCVLAMGCMVVLAASAADYSWSNQGSSAVFTAYRVVGIVALLVSMMFATRYASWSSAHRARNELALRITETVLFREQRLSALGALAAAAAHELGTPLATITVVAKEMANEAGDGPFKEDAQLLVEQAQRCREILKRLSERPEQSDAVHERVALIDLIREVVEPYIGAGELRVEGVMTGPPGLKPPELWRRQEVLHALAALVENAFDFARGEVLVTGRFDEQSVSIEVRDDGPGFVPKVLAKLGEPYLTSRPGAEGSRSGHIGMGLGFFIAKNLLERTGAQVDFRNGPNSGAIVMATWPRARIEASESKA